MTDVNATTDPIVALADTLYDALYAITPYAELHFADENEGLENAVRAVLAEAAAQQRQQAEAKLTNAQKLVDGWTQASEEHARFAQSKVMNEHPGLADKQAGRSAQLADCATELADVLNGENPDEWAYGIGLDVTEAADRDG